MAFLHNFGMIDPVCFASEIYLTDIHAKCAKNTSENTESLV